MGECTLSHCCCSVRAGKLLGTGGKTEWLDDKRPGSGSLLWEWTIWG